MEMEADKSCVGAGRTPRVEKNRDIDAGTNGIEASCVSGKVSLFRESGGVEGVLLVGRGRLREQMKMTTDDDDDKQATATTTGLARLHPGFGIRWGDVFLGSRHSPVDGLAEILASKTRGVPKKEMSGPASPLGEAYEPSPPAARTRSASRAGGRRGRGRSPNGQPGGDHRSGMIGGYVPRADAC